MGINSSHGMMLAAGVYLIFRGDLLRWDGLANFHNDLVGLQTVLKITEIGLEIFPRCENDTSFGHLLNVRGSWLELVNVGSGLYDLDNFDAVTSDLLDGVGNKGMERGDIETMSDQTEDKEKGQSFHRRN
jgi:hypothetical protein